MYFQISSLELFKELNDIAQTICDKYNAGIEYNNIFLLPTESIINIAKMVTMKLVPAIKQLTKVEFWNPTIWKIDDEKYINALNPINCWVACKPQAIIKDLLFEGILNNSLKVDLIL